MPRTSTRQACLAQQPAIQAFTRATKPGTATQLPSTKPKTASLPVSPSKKRKLQELENVETADRTETEDTTLTPSKTLKINQLSVSSPRSGHYASPKRTPSRRTCVSVAPKIDESPSAVPATPSKQRTLNFAKATPTPKELDLSARPQCFTDLLDMHSAFVQAMFIHAAHNGPNSPPDLREFIPSVTRIWRKRKVQTKDLQRLLWVWDHSSKSREVSYRLANYGLGKICLERTARTEDQTPAVQESFEQTLDLLWTKTESSLEGVSEDDRAAMFLETLGLASIHESLTPFTSFQKGQQRLQDLKGGVIRLKAEKLRSEMEESAPKTLAATMSRRQGLLDRIKNKELRQSKLPPPPSKRDVLRRAAADLVEEVAAILALLRPAGYVGTGIKAMLAVQRKPFMLDMIVQHVQDSVRNPIPRDEVEMALEILAEPAVAGHWIKIVTVNEIRSVVLKSCKDVSAREIGARVAQLKTEWEKSGSCVQSTMLTTL